MLRLHITVKGGRGRQREAVAVFSTSPKGQNLQTLPTSPTRTGKPSTQPARNVVDEVESEYEEEDYDYEEEDFGQAVAKQVIEQPKVRANPPAPPVVAKQVIEQPKVRANPPPPTVGAKQVIEQPKVRANPPAPTVGAKQVIEQPKVRANPPAPKQVIPQLGVKSAATAQVESAVAEAKGSHPPPPNSKQESIDSKRRSEIQASSSVQPSDPTAPNISFYRATVIATLTKLSAEILKTAAKFSEDQQRALMSQISLPKASSESEQKSKTTNLLTITAPLQTSQTCPSITFTMDSPPPAPPPPLARAIKSTSSPEKSDQPPKTTPRPAPVRETERSEDRGRKPAGEQQRQVFPRKPPNVERKPLNRDNFEDRGNDNRPIPRNDGSRRQTHHDLTGEPGKPFRAEKHKSRHGPNTIDSHQSGRKDF